MRKWLGVVFAVAILSAGMSARAELVWTPVNPWFGGTAFNGSWLLAEAQVHKPTPARRITTRDPIADFEQNLNRQILSRLAFTLVRQAFGSNELEPGQYVVGDFIVNIDTSLDGAIQVQLTNTSDGSSTRVEIPLF